MAGFTFEGTTRTARAGDVTLHYNEAGSPDAETLVALHGGGPGASSWSNFKQNLPALAEHYRCLLVDMPGFGRSEKPELDKHFFAFAGDAVVGLLDTLGIEKAHLLGNSLGGGTCLRIALDHPERVGKLVLMPFEAISTGAERDETLGRIFSFCSERVIFEDGFESGDTSRWSRTVP